MGVADNGNYESLHVTTYDVNGDGWSDSWDYVIIKLCIANPDAGVVGDVDGSGVVDIEDVNAMINIILGTHAADYYPGDANLNGEGAIDVEDLNILINIILSN